MNVTKTKKSKRPLLLLASGAAAALAVTAISLGVLDAAPVQSVVTGGDTTTRPDNQAETGINISVIGGNRVETVTYNDETSEIAGGFVSYSATSRTIFPGYSLLGWSSRTRTPANSEPAWTHAKLRTPAGVAALWGDPAIASNPGLPNVVIIPSLMVPTTKFPAPSIVGSVAGDCSPLGGACVARSTDGGLTFSIVNCFGDLTDVGTACAAPFERTKGHFFDGGSAAVTKQGTSTFVGWASFIDTDMSRESVWKMADVTATTAPAGTFVRDTGRTGTMGDTGDEGKEGDLGEIGTHERLRADGADLWKMSRDGADLKVNIHGRNTAFKVVAENHQSAFRVNFPADAMMRPTGVRTGPQFAFDIGLNESGQREMRFIYAARDTTNNVSFLQAGWCTIDLADCQRPAQWRFPASGAPIEFHPAIKFGVTDTTTGKGVWRVTSMVKDATSSALVVSADLVRPDLVPTSPTFTATGLVLASLTPGQAPCPDLRLFQANGVTVSDGYWGDYDDMTFDPVAKSFVRPFSDSTLGCASRLQFTSTNVHVSTVETPLTTRVHFTGTIDATDAENIGSDEHGHTDIDDFCNLDPAHPVDDHFSIHPCTGDEVVVNLRVKCTLLANDSVQVDVHADLREGDSCDPNQEQEDSEDQSKVYAVGQVQPPFAIDLTHVCTNCGDHAEVRLNVTNLGSQ